MKKKDAKGRILKEGEGQRKNGGYFYRYSLNGKRHTIYAKSLPELRDKEKSLEVDLYDGINTESKNATLDDIYELWKRNKRGLKDNTFGNYQYMYETYCRKTLGKRKIKNIKRSDILKLYNDLVDQYGLSVNTLDSINTVLHQVFNVAVYDDYIRRNVTDGVFVECKKARNFERPKKHALTVQEQKLFLTAIRKYAAFRHWEPLFVFFLGTGCRVSEVVGLTWSNIDFENNFITIDHSLVYFNRLTRKAENYISTTKTTAGNRIIPLFPEVKEALLKEKETQEQLGIKCKASYSGLNDFVFLNRFGEPHRQGTINKAIRRIVRTYNEDEAKKALDQNRNGVYLPYFSCHVLRHTFATRVCENENNLKVIQAMLGHKDIQTTMNIYADVTKEKLSESAVSLSGKIVIS